MTKRKIAEQYVQYLEQGNIQNIIELFSENGKVDSPVYGVKPAIDFYEELYNDTSQSKLTMLGIFEEEDTGDVALYFNYIWTLKNNKVVDFNVVDIIQFDDCNKITLLTIIYDTVKSRELVKEVKG